MNLISGEIRMLGSATSSFGMVNYSLIEMADGTIVQNVRVPVALDNFLNRALNSGGETQLILARDRVLMGLEFSDGKRYCLKIDFGTILYSWALTIGFTPILGIGLLNLPTSIHVLKKYKISQQLQRQGAIPL